MVLHSHACGRLSMPCFGVDAQHPILAGLSNSQPTVSASSRLDALTFQRLVLPCAASRRVVCRNAGAAEPSALLHASVVGRNGMSDPCRPYL